MRLTCRKSAHLDDWYVIERAEHDGKHWCSSRFSDADVEGTGAEMLAIADAIERREYEAFKRCAVTFEGGNAHFWSPRNSHRDGITSMKFALLLAEEIRKVVTNASE